MKLIAILWLAALAGPSQKGKREIGEVKATGCVYRNPRTGCLLLKTMDGETTYNIYAEPQPIVGTVIVIDARPHQGSNACKQGIPVDVTKWESTGTQCTP